jgi:hypothetical protein
MWSAAATTTTTTTTTNNNNNNNNNNNHVKDILTLSCHGDLKSGFCQSFRMSEMIVRNSSAILFTPKTFTESSGFQFKILTDLENKCTGAEKVFQINSIQFLYLRAYQQQVAYVRQALCIHIKSNCNQY